MKFFALASTSFLLFGCVNMPTEPSQISGSYVSSLKYENYGCRQLGAEAASLARRENQLVIAQQQRIKTSKVQAFWHGYGSGDGLEASELANVRGEKEALRKAIDIKSCEVDRELLKPTVIEEEKDTSPYSVPASKRNMNR